MDGLKEQFERIFEQLEQQFYVKSWVSERSKLIFILESPHVQELKYGAPVSGSSGSTMSKHLFGSEFGKPLGRLIAKNTEEALHRPSLDVIGLMNVCGIPMQRKAYGQPEVIRKHGAFFDVLEAVRKSNQQDVYRNGSWNVMQEVILERFRARLNGIKGKTCTLVPCGRFAQKFYRLAGVSDPSWTVIHGVPHPSYNSWDRERYRGEIHKVQQAFISARNALGGLN
ncbi:MAG TPA: hypothetical protein VFK44_14745 [Bacillales bacterium]|nr:hypothetical protein [Bacillales bacterium]